MIKNDEDYLKQRTYTNYGGRKMSADEMFEKLGYTEVEKYKNGIEYINIDSDEYISFMDYDIQGKTIGCSKRISMQELQAINKKVEELGWNE